MDKFLSVIGRFSIKSKFLLSIILYTHLVSAVYFDNMRNTLNEVGIIMGGKSGVPSYTEVNDTLNKFVSSPSTGGHCYPNERIDDLLEAEEQSENDEEVHCNVVSGEKFSSIDHNGITYKVPSVTSIEVFIASCINSESLLENEVETNIISTDIEEDEFSNFSNSASVSQMINKLRENTSKCLISKNRHICRRKPPTNKKDIDKPTGFCLKYVKDGVVAGGFTQEYPPGQAARNSGTQWKKYGFKNLLEDEKFKKMTPYDAPKGAILVYSGGKWGHVEVKAGDNEYISDYVGEKPIYDELNIDRKIIGIYVK